jgi:hypothetical protein
MATAAREVHTAEEIRDEVLRLMRMSPDYEPENPDLVVSLPYELVKRDELGANWSLFGPGTAYETPLVRAAIDDVRHRWDLV